MLRDISFLLQKKLLLGFRFKGISVESLIDDHTQDGHYNMFEEKRNPFHKVREKLLRAIGKNSRYRREFLSFNRNRNEVYLIEDRALSYIRDCKRFVQVLMVLIHLVAGK
jgi:hypothetical protein